MALPVWYANFQWEGAVGSDWRWPACGVLIYLVIVGVLTQLMKSRPAFEFKSFTVFHNMVLSLGSLAMFVGTILELQSRFRSSGSLEWFFCESMTARADGALYFWSYIYYLSKYYEMIDTVLVLLQKSRVPHFKLQVYHHAAVVPMAWFWCEQRQSLQWGGLLFNTLVHVIMYQYYAFRVLGLPTPWKRWITKLQITQFTTSFALLAGTLYVYRQKTAAGDSCAGMQALLYNCLFNATLLLQFVGVDKRNAELAGKGKARGDKAEEKTQ
ncbi:unnamed protein product [Polarella glacialis]|uniref:Elongation of fatty acids protein n=1 Tax=Polarella glacialis TaxID=89957 RepID=A0A813GFI7_POLGL|nr:unnamed protein product [Polarella glacialis]